MPIQMSYINKNEQYEKCQYKCHTLTKMTSMKNANTNVIR